MHMRISKHFLADLHITRQKQKVRSASRIHYTKLVALNLLKTQIVIIDPMPYQSTHLYIYYWEFTDGFVQGKPNLDEDF